MKTAVSIPDRIFRSAERLATRLALSRSALYARALEAMLDRERDETVTARLNEVYSPEGASSSLDREVQTLQRRSLGAGRW